jgi:pyruvate formate lyase activating enzyme
MIIAGMQKLTLLDYPDVVAATIFTQGCNFRCPFCYNASLLSPEPSQNPLSEEEVLAFLRQRRGLLDGICISGGEPLLHRDIAAFMAKVKSLGYLIKLDTNGSFPERLAELAAAGLIDYVAMDIKNSPQRYGETIGLIDYDLQPIRKSVDYLLHAPIDSEFRTTVVKELHTAQDIERIAQWIQGADRYFLQSFSPDGELLQPGLQACSAEELAAFLAIARCYIPAAELRES